MNAIGVAVAREGISVAFIDAGGVPQALALGEDGEALRRYFLALRRPDAAPLSGIAAMSEVLKRPGLLLRQIESWTDEAACRKLVEEALSCCAPIIRQATEDGLPWVAALDDGAIPAEHLHDCASRSTVVLTAVIERKAAMANFLAWWLPQKVNRCKVIDIDTSGTVRRGEFSRSLGGVHRYNEKYEGVQAPITSILDAFASILALHLGAAMADAPDVSRLICENLLIDSLGTSNTTAFGSCTRTLRGKEVQFSVAGADIDRIALALADLVRADVEGGMGDLPTVLLCPLMSDELRLRLLDLTLAQEVLLPRYPQAALAIGAALNPAGQHGHASFSPTLRTTLGVFAGDRHGAQRQRFLSLVDSGTQLPASAIRAFFSRGKGAGQMIFELALAGNGDQSSLARILVPLPDTEGSCEVRLELQLTAAGTCTYSVSDTGGQVLVSGFAGTLEIDDAAGCEGALS